MPQSKIRIALEPAIRAATPFVQEIGIHWLNQHEP